MAQKDVDYKCNFTADTKLKIFQTISLSLSFFCLGICGSIIGPTLPTLAYNIQVNISTLSAILPARSIGYLIGSIVTGLVYKKINPNFMLFLNVIVIGIGNFLIPFVFSVVLLAAINSITSTSSGFVDTAGNAMCLQIWGEKSAPYLQSMHFLFAIGTTVAPLIALPFVMDAHDDSKLTDITTVVSNSNAFNFSNSSNTNVFSNEYQNLSSNTVPFERFYSVTYAFLCCSLMTGLVGFSFLYIFCFQKKLVTDQKSTQEEEGSSFRCWMLTLLFIFFLVYVGMEGTFGIYIYTFAVKSENHYSKYQASLLNSLFGGSFAVGRLLAIPASKLFYPEKVLQTDLIGTLIAAIILSCFPFYAKSADYILWIGVAMYGAFIASIFPTGISWAEQYITMTEKATMILVVGSSVGDMILPIIVGQHIETNPLFLMYCVVAAICLCLLIYIPLQVLAHKKGKRLKKDRECDSSTERVGLGICKTSDLKKT